MTATALNEANRVPSLWQGIQTVLCCSRCKAQGTRCQLQFESAEYLSAADEGPGHSTESEEPIRMSTLSTKWNQSSRDMYSCSGRSNNSRPAILSSADTLIPMLRSLGEDVSTDDVDKRRLLVVSSHRALQRCPKTELPAQRTDERLLEVPSISATHRSRIYGEYWTPNCKQKANWDSFFESQSSMMLPSPMGNSEGHFEDATDWGECDEDMNLPEVLSLRDRSESGNNSLRQGSMILSTASRVVIPGLTKQDQSPSWSPDLSRRMGEVLVSHVTAKGMRYTFVPSDIRLEKVSDWLNQGSAVAIPISEPYHPYHPKIRRSKKNNTSEFLNLTLSELFEDRLDPERDGITFFIGPVEGRVSFKMSLCELEALEKATKEIPSKEYPIKEKDSRSQLLTVS